MDLDIRNGVLIGREGQLFLAGGRHSVLKFVTGEEAPAAASLKGFAANIRGRAAFCRDLGVPYRHVLFPDKQTILKEYFPVPVRQSLAQDYLGALAAERKDVLYPGPALAELGAGAYWRLDTHLSTAGNLRLLDLLFNEELGLGLEAATQALRAKATRTESYSGDLGGKLDPPRSEPRVMLQVDWPVKIHSNQVPAGNDGIIDLVFSPQARTDKRLLIFGDSFFRVLLHALSFLFREIYFFRTRYFHTEVALATRPDLILTGNVERYLSHVAPDDEAPQAALYASLLRPDFSPAPAFQEAFNAVLCHGRAPYRAFLAKTG